jgi:hypothetical protein
MCIWTFLQRPLTTCIRAKPLQWRLTNLATQSNQTISLLICFLHPDDISTLAQLLQSTCKHVHISPLG